MEMNRSALRLRFLACVKQKLALILFSSGKKPFPQKIYPFLFRRLRWLVETMDKNDFAAALKQIWNFELFPFRVVIYYSSEWSSSEIGDLFREHLASTWEMIKKRKNKKNGLYNIWNNGTLRCFSRLLYLECSLSCYLWLHSLSGSLYLYILFGSSSLWKDLYFFFPVWIGWNPLQGLIDNVGVYLLWNKPPMRHAGKMLPVYGL